MHVITFRLWIVNRDIVIDWWSRFDISFMRSRDQDAKRKKKKTGRSDWSTETGRALVDQDWSGIGHRAGGHRQNRQISLSCCILNISTSNTLRAARIGIGILFLLLLLIPIKTLSRVYFQYFRLSFFKILKC